VAKSKIPLSLERRHLLQREVAPPQALAIAEAYLADGRCVEAVDFQRLAEATDKLEALLEEATLAGDPFLVRTVAGALDAAPDAARWRRVADAAEAAGKTLYAADARRQAEIDEP
jgi:hypothetical protein